MSWDRRGFYSLAAIVAAGLIAGSVPQAFAQDQIWLHQFGTSELDESKAIALDGAGGVFLGGGTSGSLGGPNAGGYDAFLGRYDSDGAQRWMIQFGTSALEWISALAPDGAGGVFAAGYTNGSLGGPNAGEFDVFLARYDSVGTRLWIQQFGTSQVDGVEAMMSVGAGGVIVSVQTEGSLGGPNAGESDVYLARYDGTGMVIWETQFGSDATDFAGGLAPDDAGGVIVGGSTNGSVGGTSAGGFDCYVARFDGAGNQIWVRQFGSSGNEGTHAITPDGEGGAWIVGSTNESLGEGGDAFIAHYDAAGTMKTIRQIGTNGDDEASGAAADGEGGLIIAGTTEGSLGGSSAGGYDVFIARYDDSGAQVWMEQFGSSEGDFSGAVVLDGAGRAIVAGGTLGDLGAPNAGGGDIFITCYTTGGDSCYADCDHSTGVGVLDIFDFLCFQNAYVGGCP